MRLYRFSPIQDKGQLIKAIEYIAKQNTKLCKKITGKRFPIKSLTIFAHCEEEYEQLIKMALELGSKLNLQGVNISGLVEISVIRIRLSELLFSK